MIFHANIKNKVFQEFEISTQTPPVALQRTRHEMWNKIIKYADSDDVHLLIAQPRLNVKQTNIWTCQ